MGAEGDGAVGVGGGRARGEPSRTALANSSNRARAIGLAKQTQHIIKATINAACCRSLAKHKRSRGALFSANEQRIPCQRVFLRRRKQIF